MVRVAKRHTLKMKVTKKGVLRPHFQKNQKVKQQVKQQVKRPTLRQVRGPAKGPLVVKKGGKSFQILPQADAFQMPFKSYLAPLLKDGQFVVNKRGKTVKRGVVYPTHTSSEQAKIARGPQHVKDEQSFWREQKLVTGDLS